VGKGKIEMAIERDVDGARRAGEQQRVAVGRRAGDDAGAQIGAGTAAVVDDDLLMQMRFDRMGDESRHDIEGAGGRHRHHQMDRPCWVVLRKRKARRRRPECGGGSQLHEAFSPKQHRRSSCRRL
jgi:hypothetical protein